MRGKNLRATDRKTVLFCVEDHFTVSRPALEWALAKVVNAGDSLHVVTVLAGRPPAPILGQTIDEEAVTRQLRAQEASAAETLQEAAAVIKASGLDCPFARYHALEPIGGTATALVEFARLHDIDIAVLGSRGVGALKSSVLPSVSGLGSVSNHCVHQIHAPVLVARQGCLGTFHIAQPITDSAATHSPRKNVCLAVDPSEGSMDMLRWALHHICTVEDNVHIVNVASPVMPPLQVATETEPSFFRQPSDKIHEEGHDDSENQRLWEVRKGDASCPAMPRTNLPSIWSRGTCINIRSMLCGLA